jgi:helicase SWR1
MENVFKVDKHKDQIEIFDVIKSNLDSYIEEATDYYTFLTPKTVSVKMPFGVDPLHVATFNQTEQYHKICKKQEIFFPDKSLLQYDCGKLQTLDTLLKDLYKGDHRVLMFTQMTKMLGIR